MILSTWPDWLIWHCQGTPSTLLDRWPLLTWRVYALCIWMVSSQLFYSQCSRLESNTLLKRVFTRLLFYPGNRLTILGPRDLAGLVNLQHLIVNNNQLIKVSVQAFDDFLLTLEDLDLSYNNLRRWVFAFVGYHPRAQHIQATDIVL